MNILHITSSLDPRAGGTTTALLALAHAQLDAGLNVSIASTFAKDFRPEIADRLRSLGANVTLIGPNRKFLAWHPRIASTLQPLVENADVVHIHAVWEEIQHRAVAFAREFDKPYLFTPHGMLDPWSLTQSRLKKRLYLALRLRNDLTHAAAIHFSDEIERDLTTDLKLPTPAIVEKHVIDLSEFETLPPNGTFRARFSQVKDHPIILFLSRLHPKKGLDLLIPAFAQAETRDAVLVLAGPYEEKYKAELVALAQKHRVLTRILFTGMLYGADRVAAMVDAEILVLPSYQENFGIVVIESLAAGTPVIISDQVNIHRQISGARVGEVVPADKDALAKQITRYMMFPSLRNETAVRARPFVFAAYDRRAIAQRWVEHYQRLILGG